MVEPHSTADFVPLPNHLVYAVSVIHGPAASASVGAG